ncbi:MAG: cytidine deaminase [Gammaproteobacteria bacterium]|nr:MAG: cytidine deaminase [Gammaproteobacteria bacterium]
MNKLYHTAIERLPAYQAGLLKSYSAINSPAYLPAEFIHKLTKNQLLEALGLSLLPLAASFAVTPVSHFNVGAVAFDSMGNAYLGANLEFTDSHIGQTIHAEQSAIAHAWQRGAKDLALLVINYPPCGHCRQFINEVRLAENFRIQLPDRPPQSLNYYLPESFGPNDLAISQRILDRHLLPDNNGDLAALAQWACHNSHAPYSSSYSGIALQYDDGEIVTGRYAENAAFNPALPPLQVALNSRRLQGKDWRSIQQAVMVETPARLSQQNNTAALLETLGATLTYHICHKANNFSACK